jgi:hypothetical protein
MGSAKDKFWEAATQWCEKNSHVVIEFFVRSNPLAPALTATVEDIDPPRITFREEQSGDILEPLDFADTDIRAGGLEKIELARVVRVFNVLWDNDSRGFDFASFTELRELGKPH